MPTFVWTAKDKHGNAVVRQVIADSAAQAKETLAFQGYTDLVLKEDEVISAINEGFAAFGEQAPITAEDRLKARNTPPPTYLGLLLSTLKNDFRMYALAVVASGCCFYFHQTVVACSVAIGIVAAIHYKIWLAVPGIHYEKALKACEWHRWDELFQAVEALEKSLHRHPLQFPHFEVARLRCAALAGQGDIVQALADFQPYENQPGCPSWLYKAHVAEFFDIAKRPEQAFAWIMKAVEEKPLPLFHLNLARRYLRQKNDIEKARAALAEVEKATLPDLLQPGLHLMRGMLAYWECDDARAKRELETGLALHLGMPHLPNCDAITAAFNAYLCCVLGRQGELTVARQCFAKAEKFLISTGATDTLEKCRQAVAGGRVS